MDIKQVEQTTQTTHQEEKQTNKNMAEKLKKVKFTKAEQKEAAKMLDCNVTQMNNFTKQDPFNPQNILSGFISRREGIFGGSILLTHINGEKLSKPQLIFGTPKLAYPYKNFDNFEWKSFKGCKSYYIITKFNGMNVVFFKYFDEKGNKYISAKSKGSPLLANSEYGNFLNLVLEVFNIPVQKRNKDDDITGLYADEEYIIPKFDLVKNPPNKYMEQLIHDESIQSMSFELCGRKERHLVAYDFDIKLEPLFIQRNNGDIQPIITGDKQREIGPKEYNWEECVKLCKELQELDLKTNEEFRKSRGLPHRYEFDHFATEGRVLYCLDENGTVINRTMYKIKPRDIEEVHWGKWDEVMEARVKEAVKKVILRELPKNMDSIRQEMDMGDKEWSKFGKDVKFYVECVLKPKDFDIEPDRRHVVVLCGLPGSGKTTFGHKLAPKHLKSSWAYVCEDEPSSNSIDKCISKMTNQLKRKKHIVIDRVNHTPEQRKIWIDAAKKNGVEHVIAVYMNTDVKMCKNRSKSAHKTHATGFCSGVKIKDGFFEIFEKEFTSPSKEEGFDEIFEIKDSSIDEMKNVVKQIYERAPTKGLW